MKTIRGLLTVVGVLLLGVTIWSAGAFFAYPVWARVVTFLLVVAGWVGWILFRRQRARRTTSRLMTAVVDQSRRAPGSADVDALRERFEEAAATLQRGRRGAHALYELPWYVVVGPPGAGKTTLIKHSGLKFPVDQRAERGEVRGVGGTRNCTWWFTDHAILIDTAGRYFTQDSDPDADSASWNEFLGLLRKYRRRRPLNGVLVTVDARDLTARRDVEWDRRVAAARRRLDELNKELQIDLPVYLIVTKCDLLSGFTEFFDDLDHAGRAQVWGVTFPIEQTRSGTAAAAFSEQFGALVSRLGARIVQRVAESGTGRRVNAFAFPHQFASVREPLQEFIDDVFRSTRHDRPVLLRGVYFSSGTQEGTTIDRLLVDLHGQLGTGPRVGLPAAGPGKVYFIERLLKEVIFAEAGLAGVNWRFELRKAAWQLGGYLAMLLVCVIGLVLLWRSYIANRADLANVSAAVARLERMGAVPVTGETRPVLDRLEALRTLSDHVNDGWARHFGLYQGGPVRAAAHDAYAGAVNRALLPHVVARLERTLRTEPASGTHDADTIRLYRHLKAYLLLGPREFGQPEEIDRDYLAGFVDAEWGAARPDDPDGPALAQHVKQLVASDGLSPIQLDPALVGQVRSTIQLASLPALMYGELGLQPRNREATLRLDVSIGVGSEKWLRRRSAPLSDPIPELYTHDAFLRNAASIFAEAAGAQGDGLVRQFSDGWVIWGTEKRASDQRQLAEDLMGYYESDYLAFWDRLVKDIAFTANANAAETAKVLAGPASPLRGLLKTIDQHTFFKPPEQPDKPSSGWSWDALLKYLPAGMSDKLKGDIRGRIGAVPPELGQRITKHFTQIHRLVVEPAPLDDVLRQLEQMGSRLPSIGGPGSNPTSDLQGILEVQNAADSVRIQSSGLPEPAQTYIKNVAGQAVDEARAKGSGQLPRVFAAQVEPRCRQLVQSGQYPFDRTSKTDVSLTEFAEVFGGDGVFQRFFNDHLQLQVDTSSRPWRPRPGATVGAGSPMLVKTFEADLIREEFFRRGSEPTLSFTVSLSQLNASQFVLTVDGQGGRGNQGDSFNPLKGSPPPAPRQWKWPGPKPGQTWFEFPPIQVLDYHRGDWSFFRLLEDLNARGDVVPAPGGGFEVTMRSSRGGSDSARVRIVPDRDPLDALKKLRAFGC